MQFLVQRIKDPKKNVNKNMKKAQMDCVNKPLIHPTKNNTSLCSIEPRMCILCHQQNVGPGSMACLGIL